MKESQKLENKNNAATPLEDWLDAEEVCKILKICKKTLELYKYQGILNYTKIKKKCYYKKSDIQILMDKNYNKKL